MSIKSVMPSSNLILSCPLLLLPPIPPSIRVFSNESTLRMRWPKYWSFSFRIILSKEHPGLISFRMDWLDLLARDSQESSPTPQFKSIRPTQIQDDLVSSSLTKLHLQGTFFFPQIRSYWQVPSGHIFQRYMIQPTTASFVAIPPHKKELIRLAGKQGLFFKNHFLTDLENELMAVGGRDT